MGTPVEWMTETNAPPDGSTASADLDACFAELADRHARFMFKVANGLLRNTHDAEDAVQEALLKLYRTGGWRHMEDEKAFLARTVWRTAIDIAGRRPRTSHQADPANLTSATSNPEHLAAEGNQRAVLHDLIRRLPDELRQPLLLCAIEEMTSREVAELLGLTEGAVRTRVMRARAKLKRRFGIMQRSRTTLPQEKSNENC